MKEKPRTWDWNKILENGDFKKTDKVLETGALFGEFSVTLSPLVKSVVVTDNYGWANRRFVKVGNMDMVKLWEKAIKSKKNLKLEVADMQDLPYPTASFDKVVCISSIEHVPDDRGSIFEMMRVLKPDGLLLLTTEYHPYRPQMVVDEDKSFYRVYDSMSISKLVEGFNVIKREVVSESPSNYTTIFLTIKNGK